MIYKGYEVKENGDVFKKHGKGKRKIKINNFGYCCLTICEDGKTKEVLLNRFIWNAFNGDIPFDMRVDHKDDNKLNNALSNLQLLSNRDNVIKSIDKTKTSSKYTGVCWNKKCCKWVAYKWENNKRVYVGYFLDEEDAYKATLKTQ